MTEPPEVVLVSCAAAVVTEVAAEPALIVSVPPVVRSPDPDIVLEPLTPRVMPPLAVIGFDIVIAPPDVVNEMLPDPREMVEEVARLPAVLTVNDDGVPTIVPSVKAVLPCVILTVPVSFTFNVPTFVLRVAAPPAAVNDRAPVETRLPEPPKAPVPLVVREMPPLAVTVPLTVMVLLALSDNVNDPAPMVFNCTLPVWVMVSDPVELPANCAVAVLTVITPEPPLRVTMPDELSDPEPVIVPVPAVPKVIPPLAVTVPLTEMLLPLLVVTDREPVPLLLAFN